MEEQKEDLFPNLDKPDKPTEDNKLSHSHSLLWVLILVILASGIIWGWYFYASEIQKPKSIACTLDAMICPDGSTVGRVSPDCKFAECPK